METRTIGLTIPCIDGTRLLLGSVTADTLAEAQEQGAWLGAGKSRGCVSLLS